MQQSKLGFLAVFLGFPSLVLNACSAVTGSHLTSGGNVNNGPGPVGDILVCQNSESPEMKFTIRHTAVPTFKQGLLERNESEAMSMACKSTNLPTGGHQWQCTELREGEGLTHVSAFENADGSKLAIVTIDQIFPLPSKKIAELDCK